MPLIQTRSFRKSDPDHLEIREGGGYMAFFGLPFFGAGLFLTTASLGLVDLDNASKVPGWVWPLLVLMGLALTAVGGCLLFGRTWTTLDSTRRTILKQSGLLVPMRAREYRIDDYTTVMLTLEEGDSDNADRFPVRLRARTGPHLPLCSSTTYAESGVRAAAIADHLRLPMQLSGEVRHRGWRLKTDRTASLIWPVYPYSPYSNAIEKSLARAVGALSIPLRLTPQPGKYIRPREQEINFAVCLDRQGSCRE